MKKICKDYYLTSLSKNQSYQKRATTNPCFHIKWMKNWRVVSVIENCMQGQTHPSSWAGHQLGGQDVREASVTVKIQQSVHHLSFFIFYLLKR